MARWMALDVGSKSIGVALTDTLNIMVSPLTTLARDSQAIDVRQVYQLVQTHGVEKLIVGRPLHLGGESSDVYTQVVEPFVIRLKEVCPVPIVWAEERLSSKEADQRMVEAGLPQTERLKRRNEFAAAVILQWYLTESE